MYTSNKVKSERTVSNSIVETQLQSEDITLISIYKELTQLKLLLTEFALFSGKRTFNNKTLSEYLGVSTRTLQHWRDEGKISFTQIKDVILYKEDDVELFMKKHRRTSFK